MSWCRQSKGCIHKAILSKNVSMLIFLITTRQDSRCKPSFKLPRHDYTIGFGNSWLPSYRPTSDVFSFNSRLIICPVKNIEAYKEKWKQKSRCFIDCVCDLFHFMKCACVVLVPIFHYGVVGFRSTIHHLKLVPRFLIHALVSRFFTSEANKWRLRRKDFFREGRSIFLKNR